jgi:hypothetical protein
VRQVAAALGLSKDQVHRDQQAVRHELRGALREAVDDLYAGAVAKLGIVERELWLLYDEVRQSAVRANAAREPEDPLKAKGQVANDPTTAGLRMTILTSLAGMPERRVRIGQSLGFVAEAPQRLLLEEAAIDDMADELQRDPEALAVVRRIVTK